MTGFQELITKNNIKISDFAHELGLDKDTIWGWLKKDKVTKRYLKLLAEKFNVTEEYLNIQVNDIKYFRPKQRGTKNEYKIVNDYVIIYFHRKNGEILEGYIDLEDLNKFLEWKYSWGINPNTKRNYYVITNIYPNKRDGISPQTITLHRYLLDLPDEYVIDHINNNGLDNRRSNLRIIPHDKNMKNRKGKNSNNKSGYRNVCWSSWKNQWVVQLMINGKNTQLGYFDDVHEAGRFAEEKRQELYKEFAGIN